MKTKLQYAVALFLLLALLCGSFSSCVILLNGIGKNEDDRKLGVADTPYSIEYVSLGDGRCKANVTMNPLYREGYELIIPDNSPDGENVTEVDFVDPFQSILYAFPVIIRRESFDALISTMAENLEDGAKDRIVLRTRAFYVCFDLDKAGQPQILLDHMQEEYPFIEYTRSVYAFDEKTALREIALIKSYMEEFGKINVMEYTYAEYTAISDVLIENGIPEEETESYFRDINRSLQVPTAMYITGITLPKGIKKLHAEDIGLLAVVSGEANSSVKTDIPSNYVIVPEGAGEDVIRPLMSSGLEKLLLLDTELPDYAISEPSEDEDYGEIEESGAVLCIYSETEPTEKGNYWHYVDGIPTEWNAD